MHILDRHLPALRYCCSERAGAVYAGADLPSFVWYLLCGILVFVGFHNCLAYLPGWAKMFVPIDQEDL